jgi:hypothetical protein
MPAGLRLAAFAHQGMTALKRIQAVATPRRPDCRHLPAAIVQP